MPRTPVWTSIAATLEGEIAQGLYRTGDKLPTEAALSARFGVNRHTVRRALAALAAAGMLRTRRGSGVFVAAPPTDYPIGRRMRFHQTIRASGRLPEKRVLRVETRLPTAAEATALALPEAAEVVVYEGLSLSSGSPIAHFISAFPAARFPGLAARLAETPSVTEALRQEGLEDYIRSETRLSAEAATATQALHLGLREGDPLLRTTGLNRDLEGRPVEHGEAWFAGDRVVLTVDHEAG